MSGKKYRSAALIGKVDVDNESVEVLSMRTARNIVTAPPGPAANPKQTPRKAKNKVLTTTVEVKEKVGTEKVVDSKKKKERNVDRHDKKLQGEELKKRPSSVPLDGSGENQQRLDDLDVIIQDLIRQHKEKESKLEEESIRRQNDLKTDYSSILNSNSIDEMKEMLTNAIRENYELKQELLKKDAKFLELQLDQINSNLRRKPSRHATPSKFELCQVLEEATAVEKDLKVRLAKTEIELIEKSHILREVGAQITMLGEKCERLEAENVFLRKTHENCVKVLRAKNQVLEKRCEKTDNRRKLDRAGLSEEIRECRWLLKTLNRNVNKCAKLYADAKLELKGQHFKKGNNVDTELFLIEDPTSKTKPDRLTSWLLNTNPKVAQKAMSVWTDYLQRQVGHLEEKVSGIKADKEQDDERGMQVIYTNRQKTSKKEGAPEEDLYRDEESHYAFGPNSSFQSVGNTTDFDGVAPSPTWVRICHNAGLHLSSTPLKGAKGHGV